MNCLNIDQISLSIMVLNFTIFNAIKIILRDLQEILNNEYITDIFLQITKYKSGDLGSEFACLKSFFERKRVILTLFTFEKYEVIFKIIIQNFQI